MSGFSNPVVNNLNALIRSSIESPNYVAGVSGWAINKDGTAQFNQLTLIVQTTGAAVLIYSGAAGPGTLIGSWASAAGTDQYGNAFPAGLNAAQGSLTGLNIANAQIVASTIVGALIQGPTVTQAAITGGTMTETKIVFDSTGGGLFVYSTTTTTVNFTTPGAVNWTVPAGTNGIAKVECWGADAGAGGGSSSRGGEGGGAGEYACEPNYPLPVAGTVMNGIVGFGGTGGTTGIGGNDGTDTSFDNGSVYAQAGFAGSGFVGGQGGNISSNTIHFPGGNGGGDGTQSTGGCGGGGRAGSTGPGGNGSKSTGSGGASGGTAGTGTGGHAGGNGGNAAANGNNGGGGGGPGAATGATQGSNQYRLSASATYFGSDAAGGAPPNGKRFNGTMYQGGETASGGGFNGTQKSLGIIGGNPQSDLAGKTIDSVSIRLENLHSWFNSGLTVQLGYTNHNALPSSWNGSGITGVKTFHMNEGAKTTTDLTNLGLGSALQSGAAQAIALGPGPAFNLNYYGYFYGAGGDNNQNPLITVNWHTGAAPVQGGNGLNGQISITFTSGQTLITAISPVAGNDGSNAYAAGITVNAPGIQAFTPGSNPTTVETWHDLRPLSNSFVGTIAGRYPPQYRIMPDGFVEVVGYVQTPPSGGPNFNSVTFATMPAAYRPGSNNGWKGEAYLETNVTPVGTPNVQIDTSGNLQLHNMPASGMTSVIIGIHLRYPLDNTGTINS